MNLLKFILLYGLSWPFINTHTFVSLIGTMLGDWANSFKLSVAILSNSNCEIKSTYIYIYIYLYIAEKKLATKKLAPTLQYLHL